MQNEPSASQKVVTIFHKSKYPWKHLEVGESFVVSSLYMPKTGGRGLRSQAYIAGQRYRMKFSCVIDPGASGYRVTRVA